MSDPKTPHVSASTLSAVSGYQVHPEPFEPTYALLDPEALDLHDFDEDFTAGEDDFGAVPPWEDDLLSAEALEDLFQSPVDAPQPPPELVSFFEGELPTVDPQPDTSLNHRDLKGASPSAYSYPVDAPLSALRKNTLSPRSLAEHPIFNTHDTPVHEGDEPFEARPVEFFTSKTPSRRDPLAEATERLKSAQRSALSRGDELVSPSAQPARLDAQTPIEELDRELSRSLSDLKREAQERAARRAARRARREAQAQVDAHSARAHQPVAEAPLSDLGERHTLDETISSRDSDLPVEPEEQEERALDELVFQAPSSGLREAPPPHEHSIHEDPPRERSRVRTKSIAFMGSQGGVGVSLIVANLGVALARLGVRVALADFNPSGLNLHTYLGLPPLISTPSDLLRLSPDPVVERVSLDEPVGPERHLWLCRPASALLSSTPIEHRMRAFQALKKIDAEVVLMDLGHDADQFSLERYREATKSVSIFRPSTVSIERGHAQIRAALFSALLAQGDDASIVARALLMADHVGQLNTPSALLQALERVNPQAAILMRARLSSFEPLILLNLCKTNADRDLTLDLCAILQRKWRIGATPLGAIDHDENANQDVRQRVTAPMLLTHSGCSICSDLERFARRFARELLKVEPV